MGTTRNTQDAAVPDRQFSICNLQFAICNHSPRRGFTLVELLVVITIIGILASLITVAAVGALRKARETEIKAEIDQIATALETYKDKATSYPPNCQTDDTNLAAEPASSNTPLDEGTIFNDLKRHMKQAFPRHQEPDDLLRVLAGLTPTNTGDFPEILDGGMTAGESLVFWLGGFSSDPKYPISGEGGPSYRVLSDRRDDPIETRKWTFPFDVGRLGPRADDGKFDDSGERFVEYDIVINGVDQRRRINFWQYVPRKSEQPYLYFDTSRHPPTFAFDPPAATELTGLGPEGTGLHVHAFKKLAESATAFDPQIDWVNPDKFQVVHCGVDDEWGAEIFERTSYHGVQEAGNDPLDENDYLLFPTGPFIGEIADTIVNFSPVTRIEDAQP